MVWLMKDTAQAKKLPADVEVKKGWTRQEELGIAIACLIDEGKMDLVDWVRTVCLLCYHSALRCLMIFNLELDDCHWSSPEHPQ
jgi:hypothetical protein